MTQSKLILYTLLFLTGGIYLIGSFIQKNNQEKLIEQEVEKRFNSILEIDFNEYIVVSEDEEQVCIKERERKEPVCYTR